MKEERKLHLVGSKYEVRELYTAKSWENDKLLASCTSLEAMYAAARLLSIP